MAFAWLTALLKGVQDITGLSSGDVMRWNGTDFTNVADFDSTAHGSTDHSSIPGVGLLQTTTTTVSSAEILALNTTPKTLITAPGAGSYIVVDHIAALNKYGTAAYVVDITGIEVKYATGVVVSTLSQAWAQNGSDRMDIEGFSVVSDIPANSALVLQALVSNPTTGDGEWELDIAYRIVTP